MLSKVFHGSFFRDRPAVTLLVISTILLIFNVLLVLLSLRSRSYPVPIRYSGFDVGVFERGQWYFLYVLPAFSVVTYVVSVVLSAKLHTTRRDISVAVLAGMILVFIFNLFVSYALLKAA